GTPIYEDKLDLTNFDLSLSGGDAGKLYWMAIGTTSPVANFWGLSENINNNTNFWISDDDYNTWRDSFVDVGENLDGAFSICFDDDSDDSDSQYDCEENYVESDISENGLSFEDQQLAVDIITGDEGFTVYGFSLDVFVEDNTNVSFEFSFYDNTNNLPGNLIATRAGIIHDSEFVGSAFGYDV